LALKQYHLALKRIHRVPYSIGRAIILNNMGRAYSNLGSKQKALRYYRRASRVCLACEDLDSHARSLNNMGAIHHGEGDYRKALLYYKRAAAVHEKTGNIEDLAVVLNNIGNTCIQSNRYQQAREYLERSYLLKQEVGNSEGCAITLSNLGNLLRILGEYENAAQSIHHSLSLLARMRNHYVETYNYVRLSWICIEQGRIRDAKTYVQKAVGMSKQYKGQEVFRQSVLVLGWYLIEAKTPSKAMMHATHALNLAAGFSHRARAQALLLMYRIHTQQGDLHEARRTLKKIVVGPHHRNALEQAQAHYYLSRSYAGIDAGKAQSHKKKAHAIFKKLGLCHWTTRTN
jgi:tetratricopeptide (TPR) repeat protein